jgi:hypothetical protein
LEGINVAYFTGAQDELLALVALTFAESVFACEE